MHFCVWRRKCDMHGVQYYEQAGKQVGTGRRCEVLTCVHRSYAVERDGWKKLTTHYSDGNSY